MIGALADLDPGGGHGVRDSRPPGPGRSQRRTSIASLLLVVHFVAHDVRATTRDARSDSDTLKTNLLFRALLAHLGMRVSHKKISVAITNEPAMRSGAPRQSGEYQSVAAPMAVTPPGKN